MIAFAGIAVIMPGSCVAAMGDRFGTAWIVGLSLIAVSIILIAVWPCPRCGRAFAREKWPPYVRLFGGACGSCGLPEFAADEATAPPAIQRAEAPDNRTPGQRRLASAGDWLTGIGCGVGLLFVVLGIVATLIGSEGLGVATAVLAAYAAIVLVPLGLVGVVLMFLGNRGHTRGQTPRKIFVVVSGIPASGKSELARELATQLHWPLLDKDAFLEELFRSGEGSAPRRQFSRRADDLFRQAALGVDRAVLVSFWHVEGMPADSGTPTGWLTDPAYRLIHIHCACPPDVAGQRFQMRKRHPGHEDDRHSLEELTTEFEKLAALGAPAFAPPILVNTTAAVDVEALAAQIRAAT